MEKIKLLIPMLFLFLFSGCMSGTAEIDGGIDVNIQDYTGEAFSFFLTNPKQYTTLTSSSSIGDLVLNVDDTTNCTVFDAIDVYNNESYFQSLILSKTISTITMASELDRNFSQSNTIIKCGEWDLSTSDGSIAPETFMISPPNDTKWHMISTVIKITDNLDWDLSKFGGGSPLINGISGRVVDGVSKDLFLIYDNSGFSLRGFEITDFDKAPAGVYGFSAILKFYDIYGAIVQLNGATNDEWQAVNRDDLTGQTEIAITVNGHYVTD